MQKFLDFEGLVRWVAVIMKKSTVIGIQAKADKFDYGPLHAPEDLRLDFDVSLTPPKKFFFLPDEELVRFSEGKMESVLDAKPFVLFGVHPYDVIAIRQLDKLFALKNPDVHYGTRREKSVIVAVDVETPSENTFAGFLGFSHTDDGFDILITRLTKGYLVDVKTDKGKDLVYKYDGFKRPPPGSTEERKKKWAKNKKLMRKHELKPSVKTIGRLLDKAYDHKIWKEKARLCFSCGSCNLVCPTCYCFDVGDDLDWNLTSGIRRRFWDGCMLENFAIVAGEHNFRKQKEERFRHRYFRKGKYVPEKIGEFSCVGCGRCIGACVADIANPVQVFNAIMEE